MKRLFFAFFALAIAGLGLVWWLTRPVLAVSGAQAAALEQGGDAGRGELVFHAGGCASCHATPGQPKGRGRGVDGSLPTTVIVAVIRLSRPPGPRASGSGRCRDCSSN